MTTHKAAISAPAPPEEYAGWFDVVFGNLNQQEGFRRKSLAGKSR